MTQQQKHDYWLTFDRFRKSREIKYAPRIARVLNQQKNEFIEQYRQGANTFLLNPASLHSVLKQLYIDTAVNFGDKVRLSIKSNIKRRMPIGFNERMLQLIEQFYGLDFLNLSSQITDTTRSILQAVIINAQTEGVGFDEIVNRLQQVTELNRMRSRLIARTEVVAASNSGAILAAGESGIRLNKVWIATRDNRTRHDHRNVITSEIPIDEPFEVGGFLMMQPGDKGGKNGRLPVPAKEVCNCRCVCAFVPVRDSSGRVLAA